MLNLTLFSIIFWVIVSTFHIFTPSSVIPEPDLSEDLHPPASFTRAHDPAHPGPAFQMLLLWWILQVQVCQTQAPGEVPSGWAVCRNKFLISSRLKEISALADWKSVWPFQYQNFMDYKHVERLYNHMTWGDWHDVTALCVIALYAGVWNICVLSHFKALFPATSAAGSLTTAATERGTLNAHMEGRGSGPALFVGNQ